jgi:hypothetical protein
MRAPYTVRRPFNVGTLFFQLELHADPARLWVEHIPAFPRIDGSELDRPSMPANRTPVAPVYGDSGAGGDMCEERPDRVDHDRQ